MNNTFLHSLLALFASLALFHNSGLAQKGNTPKQDERKENERVAREERLVTDAKKDLSAIQKEWKAEMGRLEKSKLTLQQLKKRAREAREDAEDRLGEKMGIPDALTKVRKAGAALEEIAVSLREQVHLTPAWLQSKEASEVAKKTRAALLEDEAQIGIDNDAKLNDLSKLISKPIDVENEFIARDTNAIEATKRLAEQQAELDKKRKLLPTGDVEKDKKVMEVLNEIQKKEKERIEVEAKLKKAEREASKIQKQLAEAQLNLQKAKAADAADANRPRANKGK